jgi:hypothetical protein
MAVKKKHAVAPLSIVSLLFMLAIVAVIGFGSYVPQTYRAKASSTPTDPIKLTYFYKPPSDGTTPSYLATHVDTMISTRGDESLVQRVKSAGYSGTYYQYLRGEAIQGPQGLTSSASQKIACTTAQKAFAPWRNHVANEPGEFCLIHDSIAVGKAFNHDLNPATPDTTATEDWFLHNGNGERIGEINSGNSSYIFHMNPGNPKYREYFAARLIREIDGSPTHPATGMDGIFLDNIELSWSPKFDCGSHNPCASNSVLWQLPGQTSYTSSASYVAAVRDFIAYMYTALHSNGHAISLRANMVSNPSTGMNWNQFAPYLDGGMQEFFVVKSSGPVSATLFEQQLAQAEAWMGMGKYYQAVTNEQSVTPGSQADADYMRYALSSFLLVTDGTHGTFRHASSGAYSSFWKYPEYDLVLGSPLGRRTKVSDSPLTYRRLFSCGKVDVDVTNHTGTITVLSTCTGGTTLAPSSVPSATNTPIPVATLAVRPTATPIPTGITTPHPTAAVTPTGVPGTDTTVPHVTISKPSNNMTLRSSGDTTITIAAHDYQSNIAKIKIYFDGKMIWTCYSRTTCTTSIHNKNISTGVHTILAKAINGVLLENVAAVTVKKK